MITQSTISDLSQQASGKYRARFQYTLDDGRVINRGPVSVDTIDAANAKLAELADSVYRSVQDQDAEDAAEANVLTATRQATGRQVKLAYLKRGMGAEQAYKAYFYMSKVMPELLALNRTNAQLAVLLDTTLEIIIAIKQRWAYLAANEAVITGYTVVQGSF